jgi:thymidylate synthase
MVKTREPFVLSGVLDEQIIYRRLLEELLASDDRPSPRGQQTRALRNVMIVHEDPGDVLLTGVGRALSPALLAVESLQLIGGFSDPKLTISAAPHYANFANDGRFHGAYGSRTGAYMQGVVDRLRSDVTTRQAQVNFWENKRDLRVNGMHDYPCTVSSHFEIDSEYRLNGTTVMRSNDAWLGYPYDVVQHSCLLKTLATHLGLEVGTYTHIVHNMHLYEKDVPKAQALYDTLHFYRERPRMDGGIGSGEEDSWLRVQQRARTLCYRPAVVEVAASEEDWYQQVMLRVQSQTP